VSGSIWLLYCLAEKMRKRAQEENDDWKYIDWEQEEEKASLEFAQRLQEAEQDANDASRKRQKRNSIEENDDELIAKLLQDEYDEEEQSKKNGRVPVAEAGGEKGDAAALADETVMHRENRDAIEYICHSVMATNDSDRQKVMNLLHCDEMALDRIISYLIACPKIIHFHPDRVMRFFVDDDQYRNQFETNTSSGTLNAPCRRQWESNLFGESYSEQSTGIRPKYGVLMYNGYDMNGCPSARSHYGDSYLILQNVEDRVTYCYGDSGGHGSRQDASEVLGYGCWLSRILSSMPLVELQFLSNLSDPSFTLPPPPPAGLPSFGHVDTHRLSRYIEIQVHGSILFSRDVSMICLANRWKSDTQISQLAEEFCLLNPDVFLNYIE
jgi:hypothetical protein